MARMHSRKRGKSGSKKPVKKVKPNWVRYKAEEIEKIIIKLVKEGNSSSKIGLILRDSYGIPDVKILTGKKINGLLKENNLLPKLPEDLTALIKKDINLMKHFDVHKKDFTVKRGLQLTENKIGRLVKYYKRRGVLPTDWKYDKKKAKLLIE